MITAVSCIERTATPFKDWARSYYSAGANIIPITPGQKTPLVPWKQWQHQRQTEADVERLVQAHPEADIAIILGEGSGGLVDIETDGPAGERALQALGFPLPPTAGWRSKRGVHRLYRGGACLHTCKPRSDLEIRADGSYSVAPPSAGRAWLTPAGLADVSSLPTAWENLAQRTPANRDGASTSRKIMPINPPSSQVPQYSEVLGGEGEPRAKKTAPITIALPPASPDMRLPPCGTTIRPTPARRILVPAPGALRGKALEDLFRRTDIVDRIRETLGIPAGATSFKCIFPWHQDEHPSASIFWLPKEGLPVYRDWHAGAGERQFLKLPEVRAALAYEEARQLSGPEFATWALILLVEATVLPPVPVAAPTLPSSASALARKVYKDFLFLLSCKWLHTPGAPTSFSRRFAAGLCGINEHEAGKAIHELLRCGVIQIVGRRNRVCFYALAAAHH